MKFITPLPGLLTGGQLGHFALGPTMLGAPRARQRVFSDFTSYILRSLQLSKKAVYNVAG